MDSLLARYLAERPDKRRALEQARDQLAPSHYEELLADAARLAAAAEQGDIDLALQMQLAGISPAVLAAMMPPTRRKPAERTVRLADGSVGYYTRPRRSDDCWAAAVATCLQVPIEQVPDPRLDERLRAGERPEEVNRSAWAAFDQWLDGMGLGMTVHRAAPRDVGRWIGVVRFGGYFNSHTLVMSYGGILFDPVKRLASAEAVRTFTVEDVSLGYSFQSKAKE
jgi:hypothetical protein